MTTEQWRKIDQEYISESNKDVKGISVFITAALVLIAGQYICKSNFILSFPAAGKMFESMIWPELWPDLYWAVTASINYFLLPSLIIKFVFRERIRDYGFGFERKKEIFLVYALMFCVMIIPLGIASSSAPFLAKYPLYDQAGAGWKQLLIWEIGYGFQFVALEFFFRGFLLFTLARYIGSYAIFAMVVPYAMIHFGKPLTETIAAIIAGTVLGTLSLRVRSIYGGVFLHISVAVTMDILALFHKGQLQSIFLPW